MICVSCFCPIYLARTMFRNAMGPPYHPSRRRNRGLSVVPFGLYDASESPSRGLPRPRLSSPAIARSNVRPSPSRSPSPSAASLASVQSVRSNTQKLDFQHRCIDAIQECMSLQAEMDQELRRHLQRDTENRRHPLIDNPHDNARRARYVEAKLTDDSRADSGIDDASSGSESDSSLAHTKQRRQRRDFLLHPMKIMVALLEIASCCGETNFFFPDPQRLFDTRSNLKRMKASEEKEYLIKYLLPDPKADQFVIDGNVYCVRCWRQYYFVEVNYICGTRSQ
jgi:hypothetical protein